MMPQEHVRQLLADSSKVDLKHTLAKLKWQDIAIQ